MGKEIERKFLVVKDKWDELAKPIPKAIRQGYIAGDNKVSVRVRIQNQIAILNIKKDINMLNRHEFEFEIPLYEGESIMEKVCKDVIEKERYLIPVVNHIWEVDVFAGRNQGLIVAEIELSSPDETFIKPLWIGEEVTFDSKYLNTSLAENPFDTWQP
jgi:adenylate cyclase